MKLIILTVLIIKYTVEASEHYSFPPQFHKQNQGGFGSDSSIFLPPEAHTPVPYFAMKNANNLPYPYLPPTGTKAPAIYPSPFPVILSSTLVPIFDDDNEDEKDNNGQRNNKQRVSSPMPPMHQMKQNSSENSPRVQMPAKREMRSTPKMGNYHNPIDRVDMRFPQHFPMGPSTPSPMNQTPRNLIIDTHRNDHGFDHIKPSPSAQNPHYVPAAHGFTISSTTEPAIPILRLSNEMDLDGSFSYEALGADQTHYVQHSHMENMGSEKQEQVVEGSYSYVGDNGQTYTVHYVADSNGFRASGDHLPVAPPIPEIIQRAVQYNLAEEAKKPPHLRGWQNEEKDYDTNDRGQQFAAPPPPRNLFTGRTPEAFSYGFSQGANNDNNLAAASSQQVSVKTNGDFIIDQTRAKANNGPIAPQITFLASQGAHVPSINQQNSQQSIARIFNTEKPTMPQLVNYEAGNKEAEQESNKGLWRWQYGLNSNNLSQTPEKNAISRSFGEGDDIMINFGDMTPDQYTSMLQSQLEPSSKENVSPQYPNTYDSNNNSNQNNNYMQIKNNEYRNYQEANYYSPAVNTIQNQPTESQQPTTAIPYISSSPRQYDFKASNEFKPDNLSVPKPHNNLNPFSQSDEDQYEYQENPYEFRRIKALHVDSTTKSNMNNINSIPIPNNANKLSYNSWANKNYADDETHTITQVPAFYNTVSAPKFLNIYEEKTDFKPILDHFDEEKRETSTTTLLPTTDNIFKTNMFLQSLVKPKKTETQNVNNKNVEEPKKVFINKIVNEQKHIMQIPNKATTEAKEDKIHKFVPYQTKAVSENKVVKQRPLELSDVINYITNKNLFESSKTRTKSNGPSHHDNYHQKNEMRFEPFHYDKNEESKEHVRHQTPNFRKFNDQEQEELRGMIKNYKVLQRNNNAKNSEPSGYQIRKEVTPPSIRMLQSPGLPPLGRAGPSMKTYLPPIYV